MMSEPLTLMHHSPQQTHREITATTMTPLQLHAQPFQQPVHPAFSMTNSTIQLQQKLPVQETWMTTFQNYEQFMYTTARYRRQR